MKNKILLLSAFALSTFTLAQVGINTTTPAASSDLELGSTNNALFLNRIAKTTDVVAPMEGMVFYHSAQKCFKGYQNGAWVNITTCTPNANAITFNKVNKYNGGSVINSQGIGYNGETIPLTSTIEIEVAVTDATPYSFTATDATTGLTYSASGNFTTTGTQTVTLSNNSPAIAWDKYGTVNMTLTGASNTLALAPRIDVKSIPATDTKVVDVTFGGRTWMDRNLGARRVATAINDVLSYGNHYQWGRPADGHEITVWNGDTPTSGRGFADATALNALAASDTPGHPNFILTNASPYDWRNDNNNNRWATANQGPCPAGYHVPTDAQWATADAFNGGAATNGGTTVGWDNNTETYESALKLPSAGYRDRFNGLLYNQGANGHYWSSTVSGAAARSLYFSSTVATTSNDTRAHGFSVRCLKN